jgi:hypothetical protein
MRLSFENEADEVLLALTHGPTPGVRDWTIRESGVNPHGVALAILVVNGHDYLVEVTPLPDGE